ncbi:MAG: hypothetical protein K2O59_06890 [Lachnospiraceae bacterium]|nr:hypothetical protein [Lachnospiraceae bacterium]
MSRKSNKLLTKNHLSFFFLFLIILPLMEAFLTACGQDAAPAAASPDEVPVLAVTKEISASLPSENHLRNFEIVQNIHEESFSPLPAEDVLRNTIPDLSVPTYVTKVEDTYFIVDCYHNQILYHDNLTDPLTDWQIMTDEIDKGHTLASDGLVYLVDDTERNRILVFEKKEGVFYHTQTLDEVGNRPHYIVYDVPTDTFYVWSSMNGEMYLCRHDPGDPRMYLTEIRSVDALKESYVRSFTIDGDNIYFVSGIPGSPAILQADLSTFAIQKTYPVPDNIAGMVQLTPAGGSFYITVSTDITGNQDFATMIRTDDLAKLAEGDYEDVYANFIGGGTPYYITSIDNTYYLTEHRIPGHAVWKFRISQDGIHEVEAVY